MRRSMVATNSSKAGNNSNPATVIVTADEEEFRKKFTETVSDLKSKAKCTLCLSALQNTDVTVHSHPLLGTLLCDVCYCSDRKFNLGRSKPDCDVHCCWCGNESYAYNYCSTETCPFVFCKECLKRNKDFVREENADVNNWKCFVCDSKPLWELRAVCDIFQEKCLAHRETKNTGQEDVRLNQEAGEMHVNSTKCNTPDNKSVLNPITPSSSPEKDEQNDNSGNMSDTHMSESSRSNLKKQTASVVSDETSPHLPAGDSSQDGKGSVEAEDGGDTSTAVTPLACDALNVAETEKVDELALELPDGSCVTDTDNVNLTSKENIKTAEDVAIDKGCSLDSNMKPTEMPDDDDSFSTFSSASDNCGQPSADDSSDIETSDVTEEKSQDFLAQLQKKTALFLKQLNNIQTSVNSKEKSGSLSKTLPVPKTWSNFVHSVNKRGMKTYKSWHKIVRKQRKANQTKKKSATHSELTENSVMVEDVSLENGGFVPSTHCKAETSGRGGGHCKSFGSKESDEEKDLDINSYKAKKNILNIETNNNSFVEISVNQAASDTDGDSPPNGKRSSSRVSHTKSVDAKPLTDSKSDSETSTAAVGKPESEKMGSNIEPLDRKAHSMSPSSADSSDGEQCRKEDSEKLKSASSSDHTSGEEVTNAKIAEKDVFSNDNKSSHLDQSCSSRDEKADRDSEDVKKCTKDKKSSAASSSSDEENADKKETPSEARLRAAKRAILSMTITSSSDDDGGNFKRSRRKRPRKATRCSSATSGRNSEHHDSSSDVQDNEDRNKNISRKKRPNRHKKDKIALRKKDKRNDSSSDEESAEDPEEFFRKFKKSIKGKSSEVDTKKHTDEDSSTDSEDNSSRQLKKKQNRLLEDEKYLSKYPKNSKLRWKCVVRLERIKGLPLKGRLSEMAVKEKQPENKPPAVSSSDDETEKNKNDSEVDRLVNLNNLGRAKTKQKGKKKKKEGGKSKEQKLKNKSKKEKNDPSEECDSSSDEVADETVKDESGPDLAQNKGKTFDECVIEADKAAVLATRLSEDSDDEDDSNNTDVQDKDKIKTKKLNKAKSKNNKNEEEEKDKEDKQNVKAEVDDESDLSDFKESTSKWKNDRLLTARLSSTDSDECRKRLEAKKEKQKQEGSSKEDSEEELFAKKKVSPIKKRRKRLFGPKSESSSDSSDMFEDKKVKKRKASSSEEKESDTAVNKKKKVKRRRIIKAATSSDGSDSETGPSQSTPGKGRKNIRKIDESVGEATRRAAKEEEERRKRIREKQEIYNSTYTVEGVEILDKLVLDFDPETKEELVTVDPVLVKKLKPHQAKGIKFMWDACFESVSRARKSPGSGCILAHCMGLGKTLQVISLVHTLLNHERLRVKRVLVVCPLSTVLNWVNELEMWLKDTESGTIDVYDLSKCKTLLHRRLHLQDWHQDGGVMVVGYDMYRNLSTMAVGKRARKKDVEGFQTTLVDPGPDLVVCDEGHLLKNEASALSKSMRKIRTLRRIVLTGTPLQNNLIEYHCMVQFVKPNLLGTLKEFKNRFENPIKNGQYENSTTHDVKVMKRRAHVLHNMLEGCVQRFDFSVLLPYLPPKHEYVILVRLSECQVKTYRHYLDHLSKHGTEAKDRSTLLSDFHWLQRICTHPRALQINAEKKEAERKSDKSDSEESEGSLKDFIDDSDDTPESSDSEVQCLNSDSSKSVKSSGSEKVSKVTEPRTTRSSRRNKGKGDDESPTSVPVEIVEKACPQEWWNQFVTQDDIENLNTSGKLVLLFSILRECESIGDKVLVFSQSLQSLQLIEEFLHRIDEATQNEEVSEKLGCHTGKWVEGLTYFKLDGSTSADNRDIWCRNFNREDNDTARLFLISTRAGGLGINLFAANRVIIFDASWNPSHDVQSIFRVYRFGQKKPCYIYRFVSQGTMEEKVYDRQVTKLSLALRVVDEHQIERHYRSGDLEELYTFNPDEASKRSTPQLPKDRLLAEMLKEHEQWIVSYHEHESLLENKEEEELSESERKAAWEDYENEKKGKVFPAMQWDMGLNQMPTMAALKELLRQQNPDAAEDVLDRQLVQVCQQMQKFQLAKRLQEQQLMQQQYHQQLQQQQYNMVQAQQMQQNQQQLQQHHMAAKQQMEIQNEQRLRDMLKPAQRLTFQPVQRPLNQETIPISKPESSGAKTAAVTKGGKISVKNFGNFGNFGTSGSPAAASASTTTTTLPNTENTLPIDATKKTNRVPPRLKPFTPTNDDDIETID